MASEVTIPSGEELEQGGKGLLFGVLALGVGAGLLFIGKKYL